MRQTSVGTFLFPAVEILDFAVRHKVFTIAIEGLGDRLRSLKLGIAQRRRGALSTFCALPATFEHCFNATGFDRQSAHFETGSGQLDDTEIIGLAE